MYQSRPVSFKIATLDFSKQLVKLLIVPDGAGKESSVLK